MFQELWQKQQDTIVQLRDEVSQLQHQQQDSQQPQNDSIDSSQQQILQFELEKSETKNRKLEEQLEEKSTQISRMKDHEKHLIEMLEDKPNQHKMCQTIVVNQSAQEADKDETIRELNRQLTAQRESSELLQA